MCNLVDSAERQTSEPAKLNLQYHQQAALLALPHCGRGPITAAWFVVPLKTGNTLKVQEGRDDMLGWHQGTQTAHHPLRQSCSNQRQRKKTGKATSIYNRTWVINLTEGRSNLQQISDRSVRGIQQHEVANEWDGQLTWTWYSYLKYQLGHPIRKGISVETPNTQRSTQKPRDYYRGGQRLKHISRRCWGVQWDHGRVYNVGWSGQDIWDRQNRDPVRSHFVSQCRLCLRNDSLRVHDPKSSCQRVR